MMIEFGWWNKNICIETQQKKKCQKKKKTDQADPGLQLTEC